MRTVLALSVAACLTACASGQEAQVRDTGPAPAQVAIEQAGPAAAVVGGAMMLSELKMLKPEYIAGALVAFAIYDPLAPTWRIEVREAGRDRVRMTLRMKALNTGGDGEARQVVARNARDIVEAGGFAGYEVVHYEEGVESTRPFARRYANAEIRFVRSHMFPTL
ncbi:hypothetical protein ACFQ4M_11745 [Thauera mechernichensis]|uniref:DUF4426 domain-containing protein n=1 Tax=Thauera mechernichensis TaxID=82788 RepID=A0ABW3WG98_9RHOO|nr:MULTISPECIES: hypothetical protein [Thauera]HAG76693.1 hypothetical protein [Thauera sp.]ENO76205.1 hypothetical protein B447_18253 [Thauera sp. 27]ENO94886.1 hypothetical protein C662_01615 [Thauera sp. 28]MDG3063953.1 hypothetical protein [Thauera mechernichensis]WBL65756.1 hypothetical protein LQF09_08115 [Thauera sp. WB-2]